MRNKDAAAQKAAVDEYFKHWDNKLAATETEEVRKARRDEYATLTRQYVKDMISQFGNIANPLQLLQPCYRSIRIWMGYLLPLLQICSQRGLPPSHRQTRALPSLENRN